MPSSEDQLEFLQLVLNSTSEGFYTVDTEGHTTLCNAAFLQMLGYGSIEEVRGRKLHGEIHHSHPDGSHYDVKDCPIYQAASTGKKALVPSERFFRKNGTSFPVEYRAEPLFKNGVLQGAICTFRDITERIRYQEELRQSAEEFTQLANSIPQLAWMTDPDGAVQWYNRRWYDYTGTDLEEMQGWGWQTVHHPDFVEGVTARFKRAVELGLAWEDTFPLRGRQGDYRWFLSRAFPISDATGKVVRWFGTNTDIEEQKRTQDALNEKDLSLRTALQAGHMGTWELDIEKTYLTCSDTCKANYGLKPNDELSYQTLAGLIYKDDLSTWHSVVGRAVETASDFEMQYRTVWPDQSLHWIYVRGNCTASNAGKAQRLAGISVDITARVQLELTAREAQEAAEAANLAKSEFLANMSHEIRTPMNAVIGLSTILAKSDGLSAKQQDYVRTLQLSADSLLGLINDLLDISKIEARSIELEHIPFSITQLLSEVISMMSMRAKEKGLEFRAEGEYDRQHILLGDPMRLRQIILNLCSNAIKFTEKGGVYIKLSFASSEIAGVEHVSIAIADTGIGIGQHKLATIFQKFVQADSSINRKYGGTGLGLAITKTLTEIMGGTIAIQSSPGEGSTFTVTLPLMAGENIHPVEDHSKRAVPEAKTAGSKHRILLVEDYEPNVLVAGTYLEMFGYNYDVVDNGYDAVERAKSGDYLAILMDVQMHGINGFEATKLIRAYERKEAVNRTIIIGMTAHALTGDRERCLAADMDDYFSKPFNPDALQKKLNDCVSAASSMKLMDASQ